jgi:predicted Zn-dependent peptidase
MKKFILYIFLLLFVSESALSQEKELPPPGGIPKDFNLPDKKIVELSNGLKLVMIPWGKIPKATISFRIKTGNIHEEEQEVWLSDLLGDMMEEGSTSMSANEIADKLAGMGGGLNISVTPHNTSLNTSVLYEFTSDAIEILADVLINPAFPESELERLLNDRKRNLSVSLTRPQPQAMQEFYKTIYPDHPYGRVFPTDQMLDRYDINDVKSFYNDNFGAKRTTIYVAGMFDEEEVSGSIEKAFSSWLEGPDPSYPEASPQTARSVSILDRPDAPQSTLMIGLPVVDPSDPDWIPLFVTNSLLGGSFGSRITSNIREDKGYTYSPFSDIDANYKSAIWYERADVTTSVTGPSLREITFEINRLQKENPSDEELDGIKNYEAGIFVLQNSSPGGIIGQLNFLDTHNLDESFLVDFVKNIYAVTPEQVSDMTKKYIRPEEMTFVIVGDKKSIEAQIEKYEEGLKKY